MMMMISFVALHIIKLICSLRFLTECLVCFYVCLFVCFVILCVASASSFDMLLKSVSGVNDRRLFEYYWYTVYTLNSDVQRWHAVFILYFIYIYLFLSFFFLFFCIFCLPNNRTLYSTTQSIVYGNYLLFYFIIGRVPLARGLRFQNIKQNFIYTVITYKYEQWFCIWIIFIIPLQHSSLLVCYFFTCFLLFHLDMFLLFFVICFFFFAFVLLSFII